MRLLTTFMQTTAPGGDSDLAYTNEARFIISLSDGHGADGVGIADIKVKGKRLYVTLTSGAIIDAGDISATAGNSVLQGLGIEITENELGQKIISHAGASHVADANTDRFGHLLRPVGEVLPELLLPYATRAWVAGEFVHEESLSGHVNNDSIHVSPDERIRWNTGEADLRDYFSMVSGSLVCNHQLYIPEGFITGSPGTDPAPGGSGGGGYLSEVTGSGNGLLSFLQTNNDPLTVDLTHSHPASQITGLEGTFAKKTDIPTVFPWAAVTGKPSAFPSEWATVSGKPSVFPTQWGMVAGRPTTLSQFTDDLVAGNYLSLSGGVVDGPIGLNNTHGSIDYVKDIRNSALYGKNKLLKHAGYSSLLGIKSEGDHTVFLGGANNSFGFWGFLANGVVGYFDNYFICDTSSGVWAFSHTPMMAGFEAWHRGNLTALSQLSDDIVAGNFLGLSGGAMNGAIGLNNTYGTWAYFKEAGNSALYGKYQLPFNAGYSSLLGVKSASGHTMSIGGTNDLFGFWGYLAGGTGEVYDNFLVCDTNNGTWHFSQNPVMEGFLAMRAEDKSGYWGIVTPSGGYQGWVRAPQHGILPYDVAFEGVGTCYLGTPGYNFGHAHIDNVHCGTLNRVQEVRFANGSKIIGNADGSIELVDSSGQNGVRVTAGDTKFRKGFTQI